jgi:hypothetical protein
VKYQNVQKHDLRGLLGFQEYYPLVHRCVVVTTETKRRIKEGVLICSWTELLKEMDL